MHIVHGETCLVFEILPDVHAQCDVAEQSVALYLVVDHVGGPVGVVQVFAVEIPCLKGLAEQFGVAEHSVIDDLVGHGAHVLVVVAVVAHVHFGRCAVERIHGREGAAHHGGVVRALVDPVERCGHVHAFVEERKRFFQHHVVSHELVFGNDACLIRVIIREVRARVLRTAGKSDAVVQRQSGLEKVSRGVAGCGCQIWACCQFIGAAGADLRSPAVKVAQTSGCDHVTVKAEHLLGARICGDAVNRGCGTEVHFHLAGCAGLGGDDDHAVVGGRAVERCCVRAFQDRHVFDVFGVDGRKQVVARAAAAIHDLICSHLGTHAVLHGHAVDHDQRLVGAQNGGVASECDFRGAAACTGVVGGDGQTGSLALEGVDEVVALDSSHFIGLDGLSGVGEGAGFALDAHGGHHYFAQLLGVEVHVHGERLALPHNVYRRISHGRNAELCSASHVWYGEKSVEISSGALGGVVHYLN
ncbi:hypothetical protein IMSAGC006_02058 [Muribaculaceae bacterium]|nr:hypothetical protein IMSAGC006_02058 [Muribaculaceae bacterium]